MTPCAVKWCCASATHGEFCVVHAKLPKLHPQPKAPGEVECDECDGTGKCGECEGKGEVHCDFCNHDNECDECGGDGECGACDGEGVVSPAKPVTA